MYPGNVAHIVRLAIFWTTNYHLFFPKTLISKVYGVADSEFVISLNQYPTFWVKKNNQKMTTNQVKIPQYHVQRSNDLFDSKFKFSINNSLSISFHVSNIFLRDMHLILFFVLLYPFFFRRKMWVIDKHWTIRANLTANSKSAPPRFLPWKLILHIFCKFPFIYKEWSHWRKCILHGLIRTHMLKLQSPMYIRKIGPFEMQQMHIFDHERIDLKTYPFPPWKYFKLTLWRFLWISKNEFDKLRIISCLNPN